MGFISSATRENMQKERRTRKTHAKVKTGCITCKIRRKKCDETKPQCLRCTTTGRNCDGYAYPSPLSANESSNSSPETQSNSETSFQERNKPSQLEIICPSLQNGVQKCQSSPIIMYRPPTSVTFSSDTDYHCFDFVRFNTGPQFESYFDSSMWRISMVRAALSHPVVLKVATAVGAAHQRFNHGISVEAFRYCAIADRLYREAVRSFMSFRQQQVSLPDYKDVSMIVYMLFGLFETFQGNHNKAVEHITHGLGCLWGRQQVVLCSESQYRNHEMKPQLLRDLIQDLQNQATTLLGAAPNIIPSSNHDNQHRPIPTQFATLKDVSDSIFTEINHIWHVPCRIWYDDRLRRELQHRHISRILRWSAAYAEMTRTQPERTTIEKKAGLYLKIVREAAYLMLYLIFVARPDPDDLTWSPQQPLNLDEPILTTDLLWHDMISLRTDLRMKITRVLMIAENALYPNSRFAYNSHTMHMSSGMGPWIRPPHPTPTDSLKTRHIVRRLVDRSHHNDDDENKTTTLDSTLSLEPAMNVYSIAEQTAAIEEHAVIQAAHSLIPPSLNPQWVDVACFLDERRLLLRYCRPDGMGTKSRGLVWVQELREY